MSGNLIDLRKRIRSVKNTQKITRAMKTVSAVKLRKSTNELNQNRPFMNSIESLLAMVGRELPVERYPLLKKRKEGRPVLAVVSADKGLCGAFNAHVIRHGEERFQNLCVGDDQPRLITVGNKAFRHFKKKGYTIEKDFHSMMSRLSYESAREFSTFLQTLYLNEEVMLVEIVYTGFLSASRQEVTSRQLFPLSFDPKEASGDEPETEYIFEPDPDQIFQTLLPEYVDSLVYRILRESEASAHAARMIAMDLATRNASDMIRNLTLTMNKVRQAAITKELLEIITATEALRT